MSRADESPWGEERLEPSAADLGGEDLYLVQGERREAQSTYAASDLRVREAIEGDVAASHAFDPLDMLDRRTVEMLWQQQGPALLRRQDEVAGVAASNGWTFSALDAELSARLVDTDITAGSPRITRNVCVSTAGTPYVTDLTGARYNLEGGLPSHMHLRTGTAGIVEFASDHRLAAVPARAVPATWSRFGPRVETGVEQFDDSYHVYARHPEWVRLVLNTALMARLLDHLPITLVLAADQLAVIHPRWVPADALPEFRDFVAQTAFSASSARGHDRPRPAGPANARLSGWSAWPEPPQSLPVPEA